MSTKQRRHTRVPANLLLYVEQRDSNGQMRLNTVGQVLNISEGGILAQVNCPMDADLESDLVLALGAECVQLRTRLARLERVNPNTYHAAFQIDRRSRRQERSKISDYIVAKAA